MCRIKWLMVLLIISISFFYQISFAAAQQISQPIYSETQAVISVTPNQSQFIIELQSNPSTGYSWFLMSYDHALLVPIKHYFQKSAMRVVGASGVEVWIFQAKSAAFKVPQQTSLRFIYARPWEAKAPGKTVIFKVSLQSI